jgi:adenylosuccinate lyase
MRTYKRSASPWRRPLNNRSSDVIERYTLPEMAKIWSEETKLETWLEVEIAIIDALGKHGRVPVDVVERIRQAARVDARRVKEIEALTRHDMLAFVECVGESIGTDSRYFHMGVTSSDILDTSLALLIGQAAEIILGRFETLQKVVRDLAAEHEATLTVGRTHGMHAEPTSLALKFAVWYNDLVRATARLQLARDEVCVGKVSGAVGNYSHIPPEVETTALETLGLRPERPATQIVQRDRHAAFLVSLALAAAVMEKRGVELRNLQRTEIAEIEEPFAKGQKGSSSMPHKRNPITLERICGLARLVRANAACAIENIALWHERDISHSSVERVILPDSTTAVDYMAYMLTTVLEGLKIDRTRMRQNIDLTRGLVYSQRLMLALMDAGWERRRAYEKVQQLAGGAVSGDRDLGAVAGEDDEVAGTLGAERLEDIFDPQFYTRHTREILREIGIL